MEAIIFYLLKSAGIVAIFYICFHLFLKKETFFTINRHYLLGGILASILLPLVVFTKYVYVEPVETFYPYWLFNDIPVTSSMENAEPFDWLQFSVYAYLTGVLVFGMRFAIQLISLFKLFKTHTIKKKDGFNLVEINSNMSPFSFFNYLVYNPERYNKEDLDIIINHEKAHSNQLHSLDILLSQLFVVLQWFNPIAWLYKMSIQQNLEFMADQFAISKVESAKQYQRMLLKASLKPQYASITNNFYNSLIKKRIIMLNQSKSNIKNVWKYFVILPALALFLMSFNVVTVEVVKESEPTDFKTLSEFSFISEDNPIPNEDEPKTTLKARTFTNKMVEPKTDYIQKLIKVKIEKNTTDAELKELKEKLKNDGVDFSYNNVRRNDKNEIIAISIQYKDSNGNQGNYSLSSENPINAFIFYKEENGSVGFRSENMNSEQRERIMESREMMNERRQEMQQERERMIEERKALSEERRREIEERVEKAREEHYKDRAKYEVQRKIITKERMKDRERDHDSLKDKHKNVFIYKTDKDEEEDIFTVKNKVLFIVDGEESDGGKVKLLSPNIIKEMNVLKGDQAIKMYGKKGKDGVIVIKTKPNGENNFEYEFDHEFVEPNVQVIMDPNMEMEWVSKNDNVEIQTIDKNTSSEDLKTMKSDFKSKNIDFNYSKLKRNKEGEITRIKISLNDNDGNKSSSTFDKGESVISPILIGKNNRNLIIKSI